MARCLAERSYGAVGRLLLEIKTVFGITLSLSGVRPLMHELKHPALGAQGAEACFFTLRLDSEKRETSASCSVNPSPGVTRVDPSD